MTIVFFLSLAPGRVLGAEFAAIFAIFTSQAWNMAFSFYQSLRTIPIELIEAAESFRLSPWMRFWQLEVPFGMPALVWNMMMSMSGGWFFVVASESISVGHSSVALPGVGSYIALAIEQKNLRAIGWAIVTMLIVILLYDQLLFRPLVAWVDRFRVEQEPGERVPDSWALTMMRRSRMIKAATLAFHAAVFWTSRAVKRSDTPAPKRAAAEAESRSVVGIAVIAAVVLGLWHIVAVLITNTPPREALHVCGLAIITMVRVFILIALASLVWVPIGIWVGMRPRAAQIVQPIAQFMAAFPANLLFPIAVYGIVEWKLNPDVYLSPLMILGTQWYILFNIIAGASAIPAEMRYAAANFGVNGLAVVAQGGAAGGAAVLCHRRHHRFGRLVERRPRRRTRHVGHTEIEARGLGSYIADAAAGDNFHHIVLGIGMMSLFVVDHQPALLAALVLLRRAQISTYLTGGAMNDSPLLQCTDVRKAFPKPDGEELLVLDGMNLELREGQIVGLLGRSGSGKSTLAAPDRGPGRTERRPCAVSRAADRGSGARHRDGVSEFCAVSLAHRVRECGAGAGGAAHAAGGDPQTIAGRHRSDRARRVRIRLSARALRRHAATGRLRPRAGGASQHSCSWMNRSPPSTC